MKSSLLSDKSYNTKKSPRKSNPLVSTNSLVRPGLPRLPGSGDAGSGSLRSTCTLTSRKGVPSLKVYRDLKIPQKARTAPFESFYLNVPFRLKARPTDSGQCLPKLPISSPVIVLFLYAAVNPSVVPPLGIHRAFPSWRGEGSCGHGAPSVPHLPGRKSC